jgi:hypothetical protein
MLKSLTAASLFDAARDFAQNAVRLPIPGRVIGMALLIAKGRLPDGLDRAALGAGGT